MKKLASLIISVIFFLSLSLPCAVYIFSTDKEKCEINILTDEKKLNTELDTQLEEFMQDIQPFNDIAINSVNFVKSRIFKSETGNVITGNDGYYFYSETTDDILNTDTFDEREAASAAKTISLIEEYCLKNGCKFVFACAPNKASVVSDELPYNYIASSSTGNLEGLTENFDKNDINYADLLAPLTADKENVYLKNDSHWNNYGALIAYKSIMQKLGAEIPAQLDKNIDSFEAKDDYIGDLSTMLFKNTGFSSEQLYIDNYDALSSAFKIKIKGESTRNAAKLLPKIISTDENYSRIETKNKGETSNGSALILRDSFFRSMLAYFSYSFDDCTYIKSATFDAYVNCIDDYDVFVYEIAERNIPEIINSEQKMPAPKRENTETEEAAYNKNNTVTADKSYSDYTSISGTLDKSLFKDNADASVYVRITTPNGSAQCYEAFPSAEKDGKYGYYMKTAEAESGSTIETIVNNFVVAKTTL